MEKTTIKKTIFFSFLFISIIALTFFINILYARYDGSSFRSSIDIDNSDLNIKWDRYTEQNIELSESLEITRSGIYHLTGELENGLVFTNLGKKGEVKLILDNVTIKNSSGPAILCSEGNDLVIELIGENNLISKEEYDVSYGNDVKGVIYSKADLTFYGEGTLNINAQFSDGIVGKDDLKINSGNYNIISKNDGIRGKDSVYIINGNFKIESAGDAIKSTNDIDYGKGFVLIEKGNFEIIADGYGIYADRRIILDGGDIVFKKSYRPLESPIIVNDSNLTISQ